MRKGFKTEPLFQRDGGSIPVLAAFKRILGIDTVFVGFGLPNANEYAVNEFMSLENLGGIHTAAYFYEELRSSALQ